MHPPIRVAVALSSAAALLAGGVAAVHAASQPAATAAAPVAAPAPVVHIVRDTVSLPPPLGTRAAAPGPIPPPDQLYRSSSFGAPLHLPESGVDACNSQKVVHPDGFASMAASGQDVIDQPGGSSAATYPAYGNHTNAQYTCTETTPDGGVRVLLHLIPNGPDQTTYVFTMGPSGLVLQRIAPGYSQTPGDFLPVGVRLGDWPSTQCSRYTNHDLGPRHADIDDTLCFGADGLLQHATISEKATDVHGVQRDLEITVDLQR